MPAAPLCIIRLCVVPAGIADILNISILVKKKIGSKQSVLY